MAAVGEILSDYSQWPLVVVTPPIRVTDAELQRYLDEYRDETQRRADQYALVLDLRVTKKITPAQRKILTDGMADHEGQCLGTAMVFDSMLLRGILTAMFWVRRPEYPTRVFGTVTEATFWTRKLLRENRSILDADDAHMATGWVVHTEAMRDRQAIERLAEELRELGLVPELLTHGSNDTKLWIAHLATHDSRGAALEHQDELAEAGVSVLVSPRSKLR